MKPNENLSPAFIAICADDKKGLLAQILVLFNRRDFPVHSLNVARMDLQEVILITLEVSMPETEMGTMLKKIDKIVEVYRSMSFRMNEVNQLKVGLFRLGLTCLTNAMWLLLQKLDASVCCIDESSVLIRKMGTEKDLKLLYEQLEGPHLLAFCQSSLIAPEILLRSQSVYALHAD